MTFNLSPAVTAANLLPAQAKLAPIRLLGVLACVCLLVATGCGRSEQKSIPLPAGDDAATRQITDAKGQTIAVPTHPQKVLVLSELDLDAALALGVEPVGTVAGRGQQGVPEYLQDQASGIEVVGPIGRPSIEKVMLLQPDLILVGGFMPDPVLEQLQHIAPVVWTYNGGDRWQDSLQTIADALNRQDTAKAFIDQYNARIAQLQTALGDHLSETVSVTRFNPKGPSFMAKDAFGVAVLRDLGFKRPEAQADVTGFKHSAPLSLEALYMIDADWLFLGTLSPTGDAVAAMETAKATPAYAQLKAVQNDRVVPIDGSMWTSVGGPLAAMGILDAVEQAVEQAVDAQAD